MKTKILKRVFSIVLTINMLMIVSFVVSATPPKTSKKHYHSYSMDCYKDEMSLGRIIYNNKMEEYKKKGYEDGLNNVTMRANIPKGYLKVYEEAYKKGQLKYNEDRNEITESSMKANISFGDNNFYVDETENEDVSVISLKKNTVINKIYDTKINREQENNDKRLEEYKKKGYEDGLNNISTKPFIPRKYRENYNAEYERGQEEYGKKTIGKFGYEDGIKNRDMLNLPSQYQSLYEREYRKGLVVYLKDNLKNQTLDFGKLVPITAQKAQQLGEAHGSNNVPYRIGAPEEIQEEYSNAYFNAKRNKLFMQGYNAAVKSKNQKTLKKTFIVRLYGQWYNAGFQYGREEHVKQLEKIKKQGYIDGLKKHVKKTNIPREYEQIYRQEYDKGREKYIENMMEKIRKHRIKMKMKYGK